MCVTVSYLTPAVTLEMYQLPDSDEEVAEEEAIRRVLKQVRGGSHGLVFLHHPQCVCYLVIVERMSFWFWALFIPPLWTTQLQAIDSFASHLSYCLSFMLSVSCSVCLLSNPTLLVISHFLFHLFSS